VKGRGVSCQEPHHTVLNEVMDVKSLEGNKYQLSSSSCPCPVGQSGRETARQILIDNLL
jgi:hypothetical protein